MSCNGWLTSTCVKKMQLMLIRRNSGKMGMPVKWNSCGVYCHLNRTATSEQFTFFKCHMKNKNTPRSKIQYVVAESTAFSWHELRVLALLLWEPHEISYAWMGGWVLLATEKSSCCKHWIGGGIFQCVSPHLNATKGCITIALVIMASPQAQLRSPSTSKLHKV